MTITEVTLFQDLMSLDIEIRFEENTIYLKKNYLTLMTVELPEQGFNIKELFKKELNKTIRSIENEELSEDMIDLIENIDTLKEIINTI
jgi:ERCC4-related helicase